MKSSLEGQINSYTNQWSKGRTHCSSSKDIKATADDDDGNRTSRRKLLVKRIYTTSPPLNRNVCELI